MYNNIHNIPFEVHDGKRDSAKLYKLLYHEG